MLDYGFQILFSESFAVDDVSDYMYFNVFSLNLTMLHVYPFAYLNRFMYVLKRLVMHGIVAKFHFLLQKRTIVYIFSKILFFKQSGYVLCMCIMARACCPYFTCTINMYFICLSSTDVWYFILLKGQTNMA